MARVYIGKNCVFESDDVGEVIADATAQGGACRVKCCGLIFVSIRGDWNHLADHMQEHSVTTVPVDPTPKTTTKKTRRARADRGTAWTNPEDI